MAGRHPRTPGQEPPCADDLGRRRRARYDPRIHPRAPPAGASAIVPFARRGLLHGRFRDARPARGDVPSDRSRRHEGLRRLPGPEERRAPRLCAGLRTPDGLAEDRPHGPGSALRVHPPGTHGRHLPGARRPPAFHAGISSRGPTVRSESSVRSSPAAAPEDRVDRTVPKENAKALGHLVEAQARLEAHPDPAERGEVLRELALLEKDQGTLAEAVVHMNQAVDLATEVSEPGALARSLTALGSIESVRGNFERGLDVKLEALRIAERGGNLTEIARACISVGVSLHELRRYEESLKYYDRALQIGRLVGNIRLQGRS